MHSSIESMHDDEFIRKIENEAEKKKSSNKQWQWTQLQLTEKVCLLCDGKTKNRNSKFENRKNYNEKVKKKLYLNYVLRRVTSTSNRTLFALLKEIPVQCSGYPNCWYVRIQKCTSIRLCDVLCATMQRRSERERTSDSWYSSLYCWHWCSYQFACHTQCTGNTLCIVLHTRTGISNLNRNEFKHQINRQTDASEKKTEKRNWTDIMHNLTIHSMHFDEIEWARDEERDRARWKKEIKLQMPWERK